MNNVQFATAIHILTLIAVMNEGLSSSYIAGSINVNPAIVRKLLSTLRSHGFINTKEGKGGGSSLAKAADKISLSEIYLAITNAPLLGRFNQPNPECNTGRQINGHLNKLYKQMDQALVEKLSKITLADFCRNFK